MTKHSKKKSKKHNNNRIFEWDPIQREKDFKWIREFQKKIQNTFPTSSSSQHERTVEGVSVKTTLKTDQEMNDDFLTQYDIFKNDGDMSESNKEKKDEHYAALIATQGMTSHLFSNTSSQC